MTVLSQAKTGPPAGYTVTPIDMAKFIAFKQACYDAHVAYGFGSKDPHPGSGKVDFTEIDCSGFVRTLLMYAAGGAMSALPDGSYTQGEWLAAKGFKPTAASNAADLDGCLRCYVHHPDTLDETGHIFLTINGHTIESFGGHGPGERLVTAMLHSGHRLIELVSIGFVLC